MFNFNSNTAVLKTGQVNLLLRLKLLQVGGHDDIHHRVGHLGLRLDLLWSRADLGVR